MKGNANDVLRGYSLREGLGFEDQLSATAGYLAAYQQDIADLGGDPGEVPAPYLTLMPGEWDDAPAHGDADRWLTQFPAEPPAA